MSRLLCWTLRRKKWLRVVMVILRHNSKSWMHLVAHYISWGASHIRVGLRHVLSLIPLIIHTCSKVLLIYRRGHWASRKVQVELILLGKVLIDVTDDRLKSRCCLHESICSRPLRILSSTNVLGELRNVIGVLFESLVSSHRPFCHHYVPSFPELLKLVYIVLLR